MQTIPWEHYRSMSNHTLIIPEKKDDLMDIADDIQQIEKQVGRLSAVQKLLLSTDGSVTRLLETVTGNEVTVETRTQEIVGADAETAERLNICEGDQVNHRIVDLKDVVTGRVLVHAISETPVHRISSEFREVLMKAEVPIGKIMNIHEIEARREILHARVEPAGMEECRIFALHGT